LKPLLILTVGTGTAGRYSNLASGLVTTVRLHDPERYWLVPSSSPDSIGIADLVREEIGEEAIFVPWSDSDNRSIYCSIEEPDDVISCRTALSAVIAAARKTLKPGQRLVVNPTSGTKQMTAGATLAALELDQEAGGIAFTIGERHDGVVKTGTERVTKIDTRRFMYERRLEHAESFFEAGACQAAAKLLEPFSELSQQKLDVARCLHMWQYQNYEPARQIAARSSAPHLIGLRNYFEQLCREKPAGELRVADMFAGAERLRNWHLTDEALVRYYHTVETAGRVRLWQEHSLQEPFELDAVLAIPGIQPTFANRLRNIARDGRLFLTMALLFEVLHALQDPLAELFLGDKDFQELLRLRNDYLHDGRPARPEKVDALRGKTFHFIEKALPGITTRLPTGLWPTSLADAVTSSVIESASVF